MKMGHFKRIENTERDGRENAFYFEGKIQLEDGSEHHIMLTDRQMENAINRGIKNPEDVRPDGFLSDLFD